MLKSNTLVSVDIETTGLNADLHEIIEIGAVKLVDGKIVAEYSELVKPEKPVPEHITHLTGISDKDLKKACTIREVLPSFLDFVSGSRILGQNVGFDVAFLRAAAGMGNFASPLDTCELARILLPMLPSYSLDSLMEFFSLECENRHRALDDARVTAQVFLKLTEMLRMIPDSLLNEMTSLARRTGSSLGDLFESHLLERMNETAPLGLKKGFPFDRAGSDNMYGDFSFDETMPEPDSTGVDPHTVASLLGKNGRMSQIFDTYEERSGQIAMAAKIAKSFNDSEILLAEAGTGTGKSIAYLLPSVIHAEKARERVVVSTNTKNLQEQLFYKDIPLLGSILDFPFRAVILKGRGNYICINRWQRLVETPEQYLTKGERALVLPVAAWLHTTVTGDISETGFFQMLFETGLLDRINSDTSFCLGARCVYHDQCYVSRVRRAAQKAHLIIVNHSLVFSDMISDGGVLGGYARIIFD
ncbi:MAG: exonuclease domain-containing protein, partial [Candidatus Latescibacterota bacterium]